MSDRREEILESCIVSGKIGNGEVICEISEAKNAMDEYMKECCLHLLEYMATLEVECYIDDNHNHVFYMRGSKRDEILTKEQLFENFL